MNNKIIIKCFWKDEELIFEFNHEFKDFSSLTDEQKKINLYINWDGSSNIFYGTRFFKVRVYYPSNLIINEELKNQILKYSKSQILKNSNKVFYVNYEIVNFYLKHHLPSISEKELLILEDYKENIINGLYNVKDLILSKVKDDFNHNDVRMMNELIKDFEDDEISFSQMYYKWDKIDFSEYQSEKLDTIISKIEEEFNKIFLSIGEYLTKIEEEKLMFQLENLKRT